MSGDYDPVYRSSSYLARLASHAIRAFEHNDTETLQRSEFGRELLYRAHGGFGRTPSMDAYNLPQSLVAPVLKLCDQVQGMIKNR